MPVDHTKTIHELLIDKDDWQTFDFDELDFRINTNEHLEIDTLQPFISEEQVIDSFGEAAIWDGSGEEFNIVAECTRDYKGDVTFVSPTGGNWNNSGLMKIGLVNENGEVSILDQRFYDWEQELIIFSDLEFVEGFTYFFSQDTATNYQQEHTIQNQNWEDFWAGRDHIFRIRESTDNTEEFWEDGYSTHIETEGASVVRDGSDEVLLGMGRTDTIEDSDYTYEANRILRRSVQVTSNGSDVLILDDDLDHGYDLQSTLNIYLPWWYNVDVMQSSFVLHDGSDISSSSADGDGGDHNSGTAVQPEDDDITVEAEITYSNAVGLQMDGDFIEEYNSVVVQKFGSNSNTSEYLDIISSVSFGTVYLGQYGSDSDSLQRLSSVRGDPWTVSERRDEPGVVYGEDSDNYLLTDIEDTYNIYTFHDNDNYADRVIISGSGDNISEIGTVIHRDEIFGFSEIRGAEELVDKVYNASWEYTIEDYSQIGHAGNNLVDWGSDSTKGTDLTIEFSQDQSNWVEATKGESIPFVNKTDFVEGTESLYMRVSMNTVDTEYTPVLFWLEWFIDEASGVVEQFNLDPLEATWTNCDVATGNVSPRFGIGGIDLVPLPDIQNTSGNPLEATVFVGDAKGKPVTATRGFSEWTVDIDGVDKPIGSVYDVNASWDSLTLNIEVSDEKMRDFVRSLEDNAGKYDSFNLSNGSVKSIDLSENNNSYYIIPKDSMNPPFYSQEYILESYDEAISSNRGQTYDVTLNLIPKEPLDHNVNTENFQRENNRQWEFVMEEGEIYTRNVSARLESEVESGEKIFNLQLILERSEAGLAYISLLQNGAATLVEVDDGPSYPIDDTTAKRNTVEIDAPGSGFDVGDGEYIVIGWEMTPAGDDVHWYFNMQVLEAPE